MSGGEFDYIQHRLNDTIDKLEEIILKNMDCYKPEVIQKFNDGLECIKRTQRYINEIDYLVSSDVGEETFLKNISLLG